MKMFYLIPLLFLSACSTAPKLTLRLQQPPASDAAGIRYPEVLHTYHVGRYGDPNDDSLMHEQHVVYRVEENTRWNFHPGPADGNLPRCHRATRRSPRSRSTMQFWPRSIRSGSPPPKS